MAEDNHSQRKEQLKANLAKLNEHQARAARVLFEELHLRPPGRTLDVKENDQASSDILIAEEFVNSDGKLNTCQGLSLRKSVELTVIGHLREGVHWSKIESDTDAEAPRYLLHGWKDPWDSSTEELWTAPASMAFWSAIYSWTGQLSLSEGLCVIDLDSCPEVLGYIYVLEVSNPEFYSHGPRVLPIEYSGDQNGPEHTEETQGQVFARYGYKRFSDFTREFFNGLPDDDVRPDSYIFKGQVKQDAGLKILHTYRIMRPSVNGDRKEATEEPEGSTTPEADYGCSCARVRQAGA